VVTDALAERVAGFVDGRDSIPYEGVVVCHDPGRKCVLVLSYTDAPEGVRPTEVEARSKIKHSRDVLAVLKSKFPSFAVALRDATLRFEFCRDYGKGAYAIARLEGDKLEWVGGAGAC
jgi:hypothetical protein